MLSTHLTPQERRRLAVLSAELDGMPYIDKARILRAQVEQMRRERGLSRPSGVTPAQLRAA